MRGDTILLIEDEPGIINNVEHFLRKHQFTVVSALDGDAGLEAFQSTRPDLVLLDIRLPGMDGFELLRRMRGIRPNVPVIMLTSLTDEYHRIAGLDMGADDYVTKPFSLPELVARCRAVLRRSPGRPSPDQVLTFGPIRFDRESTIVTYHGTPVALSYLELRLLECLMRHPTRVFPRDILINAVYDGQQVISLRSVDAQIKRLRRKFQAIQPEPDPIETRYGVGYRLNPELEAAQ
jgi:DNA-binding response OmpR family regulator